MVPFNRPPYIGKEMEYISKVIRAHKICGDGQFTKKCHQLLEQMTGSQKVLLTTSGSHALEMAALLCNLEPGDEVILPSFLSRLRPMPLCWLVQSLYLWIFVRIP